MRSRASRFASAVALALAVGVAVASAASSQGAAPPPASLAKPGPASGLATDRIYFVMTDRYADGDPANDNGGLSGTRTITGYDPTSPAWFHGGDFKGLTGDCTDPAHGLDRIKQLGFDAIWVTPPVGNQVSQGDSGGYHGYWGTDFLNVDPHLGTDQDFADFVACAHSLGMKVIMDIVVNHTGDIIQYEGGPTYQDGSYRDCHGKPFDPAKYVGKKTFPCLSTRYMPKVPYFFPGGNKAKSPAWLNDPLNYHDRGDISSCSQQCQEWGDFDGLDDLFTEKPTVEQGLAQIYSGWITRYKIDGFRVDTAQYVNAGFFKLWVPQILAAARQAGVPDFQIFGEVYNTDPLYVSTVVRDRGLPNVLDFPFQSAASGFAAGQSSALALSDRLTEDDYFRLPDGSDPMPATFLGNHDMGRAAYQIKSQAPGISDAELLQRVLLGYDVLYLLRGAPVVMYGDEVGMMGTGGDQQARQDMFPTQVTEWQDQPRVGSPPIGTGSSFDVTGNPIEARIEALSALREQVPALETGASIVRYSHHSQLAVSRIDAAAQREYLTVFNSDTAPATLTFPTATPSSGWTSLFGDAGSVQSDAKGTVTVTVPAEGALLLEAQQTIPVAKAPTPKLTVHSDSLTDLWAVNAAVSGTAPVTVAFAVKRASGGWKRLDVDDSPPYRAFLDPAKYKKNESVQLAAIVRALDGSTATSKVVTFRVHGR
ncbi:MAG TPA: alpha-amylase family glycosyl hydrolase [Gaiellaceae bacterium]|nr:alpha-amylase family glycosyl hydrolase [Gaiellaceae bacterium]